MKFMKALYVVAILLFCAIIGMLSSMLVGMRTGSFAATLITELAVIVIAFFFHTVLHEVGHLIAGLISGYRFVSFRIGSIALIHANGKWLLRCYAIPGTAGQCLMAPPEGDKVPYRLYHLGGVLINVFAALIFTILFVMFREAALLAYVIGISAAIGAFSAIFNGIPMVISGIPNDGYNLYCMIRNPDERTACLHQLNVTRHMTEGESLAEMPEEWFELPETLSVTTALSVGIAVFAADRYADKGEYANAVDLVKRVEEQAPDTAGYLFNCLKTTELLCLLVQGKLDDAKAVYNGKIRHFILSSPSPAALLVAALMEPEQKAQIKRKQLDRVAKRYPFPAEIGMIRRIQSEFPSHDLH